MLPGSAGRRQSLNLDYPDVTPNPRSVGLEGSSKLVGLVVWEKRVAG